MPLNKLRGYQNHWYGTKSANGALNGDLSYKQCNKGTEKAHHVLCECEVLDQRRQVIYGNIKLSLEEYDKHQEKELYG